MLGVACLTIHDVMGKSLPTAMLPRCVAHQDAMLEPHLQRIGRLSLCSTGGSFAVGEVRGVTDVNAHAS